MKGIAFMLALFDNRDRLAGLLARVIQGALVAYAISALLSISAMQAAYILALVAWAWRLYLTRETQHLRWPLLLPYVAFVLASGLATLCGVEPWRSLVELRNVGEMLLFYLVVNTVTSVAHATRLTRVLIITGTVMALYGLAQSFAHGVAFRVYGTMSIYMTFAGLLMLVLLLALAQLLAPRSLGQRRWLLPAVGLMTAALLMTHTRGAWCGLVAGGVVLVGCQKRLWLLALPVVVLLILALAPPSIRARALSIMDRREITAQERISMWASGVQMVRDHPWTGIGMGAMVKVYAHYREPDSPVATTRRIGHLHNNVVQMAAERGLLGLASWLWLWLAYGWHAWRIFTRLAPEQAAARALVVGSLASVVAFHVEGLFEHTFGDTEVVTLTYFLMALPFVAQRSEA